MKKIILLFIDRSSCETKKKSIDFSISQTHTHIVAVQNSSLLVFWEFIHRIYFQFFSPNMKYPIFNFLPPIHPRQCYQIKKIQQRIFFGNEKNSNEISSSINPINFTTKRYFSFSNFIK